jgi:hypothetical protein
MIVFAIEKSVSLDQVARYIKLIGHPMFFIWINWDFMKC